MEEHSEFRPLLTVAGGPMRGLSFRLGRIRLVVGRAPTADVVVADPHLSRRHVEMWLAPEGASVADLSSTNGTWLNDRRITGVERLADGDVLRIGRTELRVYDPGVARTDPIGLSFGQSRRDHRPTLPLPIAGSERIPGEARPAGSAPELVASASSETSDATSNPVEPADAARV
ncbi:FHA domain-containing protein [Micromonospora sp. WMMA1363]|uniref:FHA domain-containing protein n=1 Tax=Micromonospora sp. WMMA1363 TaxID=3053985 RepID=UPI00259CB2B1|nr:FHA domain-containing protein [Micromonospora sp. WMMA1363]MDM4720505.1 FHA domain-containing protein [Micromonospora sp. WMMA1363]